MFGISLFRTLTFFGHWLQHFKGLSFETISSVGGNAAIIHYAAKEETCAEMQPDSMYLCDSGGQVRLHCILQSSLTSTFRQLLHIVRSAEVCIIGLIFHITGRWLLQYLRIVFLTSIPNIWTTTLLSALRFNYLVTWLPSYTDSTLFVGCEVSGWYNWRYEDYALWEANLSREILCYSGIYASIWESWFVLKNISDHRDKI